MDVKTIRQDLEERLRLIDISQAGCVVVLTFVDSDEGLRYRYHTFCGHEFEGLKAVLDSGIVVALAQDAEDSLRAEACPPPNCIN